MRLKLLNKTLTRQLTLGVFESLTGNQKTVVNESVIFVIGPHSINKKATTVNSNPGKPEKIFLGRFDDLSAFFCQQMNNQRLTRGKNVNHYHIKRII